ncbi:MAG: ion transporter [Rhodobacteraceae bacterium]|nr:ion transporter [Paracoccaceae bacterium]
MTGDGMAEVTNAKEGSARWKLAQWIESPRIRYSILGLIVLNALTLGLSTSDRVNDVIGPALSIFDNIVLWVFVAEMAIKIYAFGFRFFKSPWNLFDLTIVSVGLLPTDTNLSVLRALRVIRAMRILSVVPQLRSVIRALLEALPGMGAVIILLFIVYYIFAVMATMLYSEAFPQWFGTIGESLYSLFQIMTLESWSMGIVRPIMEEFPWAWLLFVPFIVATSFAVLNLFIGILVNTMQAAVEEAQDQELERILNMVMKSNEETKAELAEMKALLKERS